MLSEQSALASAFARSQPEWADWLCSYATKIPLLCYQSSWVGKCGLVKPVISLRLGYLKPFKLWNSKFAWLILTHQPCTICKTEGTRFQVGLEELSELIVLPDRLKISSRLLVLFVRRMPQLTRSKMFLTFCKLRVSLYPSDSINIQNVHSETTQCVWNTFLIH